MKKRMKPILILILAMIMVITSVPVQTNAAANARARGKKKTTQIETQEESAPTEEPAVEEEPAPAEEPALAEEPAVEEEPAPAEMPLAEEAVDEQKDEPVENAETVEPASEVTVEETTPIEETAVTDTEEEAPVVEETATAYPPASFDSDKVDGVTVHVDAPENALPEGSTMEVSRVNIDAVQDAVDKAEDIDGTVVAAVDITFFNAEGICVEPKTDITVTMATKAIAKVDDDLAVVHIDANADEIEELDIAAEDVEAIIEDDTVIFDARSFSVYAIIGPNPDTQTPYRTTFEFYNSDGSKYEFLDNANRKQYTQILKDGEVLEEVGIPTKGASQNARFMGWFDEDGKEYKIGEPQEINANTTIKLTARFQAIVNVFFVTAVDEETGNRSIVTVKQVEYTIGQEASITVDTNDVTTNAPSTNQAVVGWNTNEIDASRGIVASDDGIVDLTDRTSDDVMMFPAIARVHWLTFNENDGGTGGGASYVPPQYVKVGGTTTEPADPTRKGYSFGGWYEDAECTQSFTFGRTLNEDKTVYAKWNPDATTYTVIIWVQRTLDSASITSASNLPENERSYDFREAFTINSQTGATATVANTYKQRASQYDANGHIDYSRCDSDKTVAADGSTVMNVYYDRDVMTIHFKQNRYDGSDLYTWYGLYDATFSESGKVWPDLNNRTWQSATYTYTFLDSFKSFDKNTDSVLTVWQINEQSSSYNFIFQKETLTDNTYTDAFRSPRNASLKLSEKYTGFYLYQYRNGSSGSWTTLNSNTNGDPTPSSYPTIQNNNSNLTLRYKRKTYELVFYNGTHGTEGTELRTDNVKYEAPLANHATPADPTYPDASMAQYYDFIGWFADSTWTTMVTFTELDDQTKNNYRNWYGISTFITIDKMPAHNIPLYAGYSMKGWDCALNPNGGTLDDSQAGVFWVQYGNKISDGILTTTKREGYTLSGWVESTVDGELLDVQTDSNNHRYVGDFSNWTEGTEPWNFDTEITGPVYLTAVWYSKTALHVVYDLNGGTGDITDNGEYRDHSQTVAFGAPNPPEGKNFVGWDIVGTDTEERLHPGETFEVSSDYAVNGVVTLKAVYHEFTEGEEVPVTHITWYANNDNTTQLQFVTDDKLQTNAAVAIRPSNTFTYEDHVFIGWAKKPNATKDELFLKYNAAEDAFYAQEVEGTGDWTEKVTQVAADEKQPYDDLYAIWEGCFYVYHSGVAGDGNLETIAMNTANLNDDGTYDLTKVTSGTLYGGYYLNYAGKGDYAGHGKKGTTGVAYNGMNYEWSGAQTENGKNMTPAVGETYYIKEVPTYYLRNYYQINFIKVAPNDLKALYLISAIDDLNYDETGFVIKSDNKETAVVVNSLQFQNYATKKIVTLKANSVFKSLGITEDGEYLTYFDATDSDFFAENSTFTVLPYWITPDGITVNGTSTRTIKITTLTKSGISKTDS